MAILPIRIFGDPVLHSPAHPVNTWDQSLLTLVNDMVDTMHAAPGVGLAAPQVGIPLRLFVYEWCDDEGIMHCGTAVNPTLLMSPPPVRAADGDHESEGCLSFPGERFPLVRAEEVLLSAQDCTGKPFELRARGWLARIFQHEFDHLNGLLYLDRLDASYGKQVAKIARKNGWGSPEKSWLPGKDLLEGSVD